MDQHQTRDFVIVEKYRGLIFRSKFIQKRISQEMVLAQNIL